MIPFGRPHNLRAIAEMLDLARATGVKLQFSHLIFAGARTWPTMDRALRMFDVAIADGVDVQFDIFPNSFGATLLNTLLPAAVKAKPSGDRIVASRSPWGLSAGGSATQAPAALARATAASG